MKHIGIDEAGKGDYFGYLVVAGVVVDDKTESVLKELCVRDSKTLSDYRINELDKKIRKFCKHNIVKISPSKYNELYKKFANLNKLLAWAHAKVIENILQTESVELAISDKFGDEHFITDALQAKGKKIKIEQRTHGEEDIAVAAASVVARAEFLGTLRQLGRALGIVLPKGATHVTEIAKQLVKENGPEILNDIAKVHFKITKKIVK